MIYLDWAATAIPNKLACKAAIDIIENNFGNPSSIHQFGLNASSIIEECRDSLSKELYCSREKLYFCSSGTEANNIVISSLLQIKTPGSILISPIEHPSIDKSVKNLKKQGWDIIKSPIQKDGLIDAHNFLNSIKEDTLAVFIMAVNNENGAILPIQQISDGIIKINESRTRKIRLHIDAVQSFGRIKIDISKLKPNSLCVSGHKIGSIKGAALLYLSTSIEPIYGGGGQEKNIRSGTENCAAIKSLAVASREYSLNYDINFKNAIFLKSKLLSYLTKKNIPLLPINEIDKINNPDFYSPYIIQCSIPPLPSEVLVRVFNDSGIALSGGSACSANSKEKTSRVSKAIGISDLLADSAIRISTGPQTTMNEIEKLIEVIEKKILPLAKSF